MSPLPHRTTPADAMRAALHRAGASVVSVLLAFSLAWSTGAAAQAVRLPPSTTPAVSLEYAVKATYLYKLAPFVDWPAGEFAAPDAPFAICVVGDDPFGGFLEHAVAGRRFGEHPFEVRKLASLSAGASCQIAFIGHLTSQSVRQALAAVNGRPVLTVIDSAVEEPGGIVQFVITQGRVGFEIDTVAAARNHLSISSKLLSLARAVRASS